MKIHSPFVLFWLRFLGDVVIVVALVVFFRAFVFSPFHVTGSSMCDSFNNYDGVCLTGKGEQVLVTRHSNLQRGDVIVLQDPYDMSETPFLMKAMGLSNARFLIKRVIGLPGETVRIADGKVYLLNGEDFEELPEPYLNERNSGNTNPHRLDAQTFVVPQGEYFVLGDNRTVSTDSRRCFMSSGCGATDSPYLPEVDVEGEVKVVTFPLSHFRWIHAVDYSL